MEKYLLKLSNNIFKDEKSQKEIRFSKLSLDLGYKEIKLTTDVSDICTILDITERHLKMEIPYDGKPRLVGFLNVGSTKGE